jgi:pentatricopeptide repeat protein
LRNARFVLKKAEEAGLVNVHILNGMMQVYTSNGSLDDALALYDDFKKHNLVSQQLEGVAHHGRYI